MTNAMIYGLWHPKETKRTLRNVRYIGKTTDPITRLRRHFKPTSQCPAVRAWVNAKLRPYGLMPYIDTLETVLEADWRRAECDWIAKARTANAYDEAVSNYYGNGLLNQLAAEGICIRNRDIALEDSRAQAH